MSLDSNEIHEPLAPEVPAATTPVKSAMLGVLCGILKGVEKGLDFSPLITVQILKGSHPPLVAMGGGTLAAAIVMVYALFKICLGFGPPGVAFPKTLDLGLFLLFGGLWLLALVFQENAYVGRLLVLWFNPVTTGGIATIMWVSVVCGRSFVAEAAQAQLPPRVWQKLASRKWFRDTLDEVAWFWVKILSAMAGLVTVQPLVVTLFYAGSASESMQTVGTVLQGGQYAVLFYGIVATARDMGKRGRARARARAVRAGGLRADRAMWALHGEARPVSLQVETYSIQSLASDGDPTRAARVLVGAFRDDDRLDYLGSEEGKRSWFTSSLLSLSYFNLVLTSSDAPAGGPRCVMACVPVLSRDQDELNVFNSNEARLEHGFAVPGASEADFPLPDDDLFEMSQLKKKRENGLATRRYIYIHTFGTDSSFKGRGYGRILLRYIVEVSEARSMPLVLETTNALSVSQYERYGFRVVDRVVERPEWVLMVREAKGLGMEGPL